ncbi:hypothetical protein XM38_023530 [Halomicronema hongdechloris C2206]|uniref:t-SNARE coiled-coil homology domain-containing protein n=1 Tax=Halomicronema hongdechloris C2206 TaxID=1641165 RepID=A0A1Z3HM66_9CYAN|nr:P-loop NTPase fold protein [Halomicronema hongdechloris]ASC71401.1 hypothetical protein XM38_023530 [Halomicronema hongdechloris C2206]
MEDGHAKPKMSANSHVREYLNYYCRLPCEPRFAVLLKGEWGSGKTWFINRYEEILKERNQKCLYISLYGISNVAEIDDKFFQLLYPIRSSKGMAITGIIVKGLLKGALKIDLNSDGKDDATWNIQIPEINFPERLKDINQSILIFDDLERCSIELGNLLGYINYFVEHQGLKVILIANEDELSKNESYKAIKEKLIGKTFSISPDFRDAMEDFVSQVHNEDAKNFLLKNSEKIRDLYNSKNYQNLRILNQIILEFERIFEKLPGEVKSRSEILENILENFVNFSTEISCGSIHPKDLNKLWEEYNHMLIGDKSSSNPNGKENEEIFYRRIFGRHDFFNSPFPNLYWWEVLFDKGVIDEQELKQSILSSKYFQDENTPDWTKLWHYSELDDDKFNDLIKKVEVDYGNRIFTDIGIIKHIVGLFLKFSDAGVYPRSKQDILEDSKRYIDDLRSKNKLEPFPKSSTLPETIGHIIGGYQSLEFMGKEFEEFEEFCNHLNEIRQLVTIDKIREDALCLLDMMKNDVNKLYRILCFDSSPAQDESEPRYHEIPILNYIPSADFMASILTMKPEEQRNVFSIISERYKYQNINKKLIEELEWLKSVQTLLLEESSCRQGKLSEFRLKEFNTYYLKETIARLATGKETSGEEKLGEVQ